MLGAILDFLTNRKFKVELGDSTSNTKELDRGCVQGSLIGPRLFSLYVGGLASHLKQAHEKIDVISYADDTYVIASAKNETAIKTLIDRLAH